MRFAAIGFDAADTLFHNAGLSSFLASVDSATSVHSAIHTVGGRGLWPEDSATHAARVSAWSDFYELVFAEAGHGADEASRLGRVCAALVADPASYRLFDDVGPTLDAVDRLGVRVCVISNFDPLLAPILDHLQLANRFHAVVSSWDAGCYKPDPAIFRLALARTGVAAHELLFVGDSPRSDVGGATRCGIPAILLDRGDRHIHHPGPRIRRLTDVLIELEAPP